MLLRLLRLDFRAHGENNVAKTFVHVLKSKKFGYVHMFSSTPLVALIPK